MIPVNPVLKQCVISILAILFLTSCQPPKTRERFTHAMLHPNETFGLFVFKREHYYPGDMLTGTPDRYVVNVTIIGAYDLASGKVRVLYRKDNGDKYLNEENDFHIVQMFGSRALVNGNDEQYNWLDINTGGMTPVRLAQELAERHREVGYVYLVDEQGTLILDNTALGEAMNYSAPRELWVRRSNGDYDRVGERSGFSYGFRNNELYFFVGPNCQIYNLDSRATRPCENHRDVPTMKNLNPTVDFQTDDYGSPQPTIGRKVGGKWIREETHIDTSSLR